MILRVKLYLCAIMAPSRLPFVYANYTFQQSRKRLFYRKTRRQATIITYKHFNRPAKLIYVYDFRSTNIFSYFFYLSKVPKLNTFVNITQGYGHSIIQKKKKLRSKHYITTTTQNPLKSQVLCLLSPSVSIPQRPPDGQTVKTNPRAHHGCHQCSHMQVSREPEAKAKTSTEFKRKKNEKEIKRERLRGKRNQTRIVSKDSS